jgi:hypothetical protein
MSINDPLGRIEALEAEQKQLREEFRKLKEQQTEPMHVTRIELDPGGIQNRLDNHAEMMKEQDEMLTRIYTDVGKANTEIALLKGEVAELRTDMQKRLDSIAQVQNLILSRLPEKGE